MADENVFDIVQGVSVSAIRKLQAPSKVTITYGRIFGSRSEKYDQLSTSEIYSAAATAISPSGPLFKFTGDENPLEEVYQGFPSVEEIFPVNSGSIITSRDNLTIDRDVDALLSKVRAFAKSARGDKRIQEEIGFSVKSKWDVEACKKELLAAGISRKSVRPILYRPFDERSIYYFAPLLDTPSRPVCEMIGDGGNLVLLTPKVKTTAVFNHVLVTRVPAEKKACSHDRATQMFPLYRKPDKHLLLSMPGLNLDPDYLKVLSNHVGVSSTDSISGESVFHYIYAVLHSAIYRQTFGAILKDGYPRIPFVESYDAFKRLSSLGADLVGLHLLDEGYSHASWNSDGSRSGRPFVSGLPELVKKRSAVTVEAGYPLFSEGTVWLSPDQGFVGVPVVVWGFLIGGYQVCEKWLKDRRGTELSDSDVQVFKRVVGAISHTLRLMKEIDLVIRRAGGFFGVPLAKS